jgi:archaemetzincin
VILFIRLLNIFQTLIVIQKTQHMKYWPLSIGFFIIMAAFTGCRNNPTPTIGELTALISKNDIALGTPQPGEWLFHHPEKGQSFEQYRDCDPVSPDEKRKVIYIQPIGHFDAESNELIRHTADYVRIFFGLKTVVLKTIGNDIFPDSVTRSGELNDIQIFAPYILNEILIRRIPEDAITLMALTEKDLYPNPEWNFVFGLANLRKRVGVTSMYRLIERNGKQIDYPKSIERLIKVTSHEMSHMFTIHHCTHAVCTMNGSNGLPETDKKPNRMCSECNAKIIWNLKVDPFQRMEGLQQFFRTHHLVDDLERTEADIRVVSGLNR